MLIPTGSYAHGSGFTLSATTTDYFVDIDYGSIAVVAQESDRFTFQLYKDADRVIPADFSEVWVRISKRTEANQSEIQSTVFNGLLAQPSFGPPGVMLTLYEPGQYNVTARFTNGDDELAEVTLPFTVAPSSDMQIDYGRDFWFGFIYGVGATPVVALALWFILRRRESA